MIFKLSYKCRMDDVIYHADIEAEDGYKAMDIAQEYDLTDDFIFVSLVSVE